MIVSVGIRYKVSEYKAPSNVIKKIEFFPESFISCYVVNCTDLYYV